MKHNYLNRIKHSAVTIILIICFLSVPVYMVFSQSQSDTDILTFKRVLEEKGSVSDFIIAVEEYEKSLLEQQLYNLFGDTEFGVSPAVRTQWINVTDPLQTDINVDLDLNFYVGRNPVLEEKYRAAVRNAEVKRLEMDSALNETVLSLYNLYSTVWLLQQDSIILEKEKQLGEIKYAGAYERYIEGVLTLNELEDAGEELLTAEDALQQNFLAMRLAWFSLQQYRGKSENLLNVEIPVLEEFRFEVNNVQKPVVLSEQVLASDSNVLKLKNTLASLNETAERLRNFDLVFSLKPYMGYDDYSANLAYVPENRQFNISTSIPIASFNSSDSQDSEKKWNAGISIVFEIDSGKQNKIENEILKNEIGQQEILLKQQIDKTVYELRSSYQQFIQAQQTLDLSEKEYSRQIRQRDAVQVRLDSGQALRNDLLSADIAVQRSEWKNSSARISLQKAYMTLIVLTGAFPF